MFTYKTLILISFMVALVLPIVGLAQSEVVQNIKLEPARFELTLDPGESQTFTIKISNNLGRNVNFSVETEDFEGTEDGTESLVLLGDAKGKFSLKDAVSYPVENFSLGVNESVLVPVTVSIPADSAHGGLFASVLFTIDESSELGGTGTNVETRVGALIFTRVGSDVIFSGDTEIFETLNGENIYVNDTPAFVTTFRNTGNVHLNPYGGVQIKNMFGRIVEEISIDPWFVLPGSLRSQVIEADKKPFFGLYTAKLELNKGYDDVIDTREVSFWVISWRFLILVATLVLAGLFSFRAYKLKQYAQKS